MSCRVVSWIEYTRRHTKYPAKSIQNSELEIISTENGIQWNYESQLTDTQAQRWHQRRIEMCVSGYRWPIAIALCQTRCVWLITIITMAAIYVIINRPAIYVPNMTIGFEKWVCVCILSIVCLNSEHYYFHWMFPLPPFRSCAPHTPYLFIAATQVGAGVKGCGAEKIIKYIRFYAIAIWHLWYRIYIKIHFSTFSAYNTLTHTHTTHSFRCFAIRLHMYTDRYMLYM